MGLVMGHVAFINSLEITGYFDRMYSSIKQIG